MSSGAVCARSLSLFSTLQSCFQSFSRSLKIVSNSHPLQIRILPSTSVDWHILSSYAESLSRCWFSSQRGKLVLSISSWTAHVQKLCAHRQCSVYMLLAKSVSQQLKSVCWSEHGVHTPRLLDVMKFLVIRNKCRKWNSLHLFDARRNTAFFSWLNKNGNVHKFFPSLTHYNCVLVTVFEEKATWTE